MLISILGRQPKLSLAELEAVFGDKAVRPLGADAAFLDVEPDKIGFSRLGGSVKLAKQLLELPTDKWSEIEKFLVTTVPEHLKYLPEGKLRLGLNVHGFDIPLRVVNATGLKIKKAVRSAGRSVRLIPNKKLTLSSPQVIYNQLAGPLGWDFLLIRNGDKTVVAQTIAIQNINDYSDRDYGRPKRDARVGMLPPKLAQILINLAVNQKNTKTILDPFCGTGVILQEALLMGYGVYGTDLEQRMVEYSKDNIEWFCQKWRVFGTFAVFQADATSYTWPMTFDTDTIASETYLGRPFSVLPKPDVLEEVVRDVDTITGKFLKNVARQTKTGFRMCIAVPAWKTSNGFRNLPMLDHLTDLGYNRVSFVHARNEDLIYHREGQIVGRELVVLTRI